MNWKERIAKAQTTGKFSEEDKELAGSIKYDSLAERIHTLYVGDIGPVTYDEIYCKYTEYDELIRHLSTSFTEQVERDEIDSAESTHLRTQSLRKLIPRDSRVLKYVEPGSNPEPNGYSFLLTSKNNAEYAYRFIRKTPKLQLGTIMCSFGKVSFICKVTELTIDEIAFLHKQMQLQLEHSK